MAKKHSRLFYRAVARIRAVGEKDGIILLDRLRIFLQTGYVRANQVRDELIEAGVLREWDEKEYEGSFYRGGNILWENISKIRVPREITKKETARVKEERRKGTLPKTLEEYQKKSRSQFKYVLRP